MKVMLVLVAALFMFPVCAIGTTIGTSADPVAKDDGGNVIARVGDQTIAFGEINTALNSSAIVGVSIPALGTPERDTARITLLDRFISANLLYLDALDQGVDKDPRYRRAVSRFSDAILAGLYRKRNQAGAIPVSDEEVQTYFKRHMKADAELTDDLHLQIESTLRRQKLHERMAAAMKTLRDDIKVTTYPENLAGKDDAQRPESVPLAAVGPDTITWGQVSDKIIAAGKGATMTDPLAFEEQARRDALDHEIDLRITVQKAAAAGLENDPLYRKRMKEYRKTLLTNLHREQLAKRMEPSDKELQAYYEANRSRFIVPESRKVQMVVVGSKEEAGNLKSRIETGDISMYQAARDHSLAADAGQNLGELGWISQGQVAPALDKTIFTLGPGEISDPVESPAGWHLVTVLEINDASHTDFADETTRKLIRRKCMHDRLDAYTAKLRKDKFTVEVYQDRLVQLAQQEADMVKALAEQAHQPGSITQQRIDELNKIIKPAM